MNYLFSIQSDVGITKDVNQDAVGFKSVKTSNGNAVFCVICDGMGGYDKGELASSSVVKALIRWFDNDFPKLVDDYKFEDISAQWNYVIQDINRKIINYGRTCETDLGTTLSAILIFENKYYICHVGDSRIYIIRNDNIIQLTKDHTLVAKMLENNEITEDEIETHPDRNILTQCIGVSGRVAPQFEMGDVYIDDVYLLCSDGFRHEISKKEMVDSFNSKILNSNQEINTNISRLIERAEMRKEEDNISVAVIKII